MTAVIYLWHVSANPLCVSLWEMQQSLRSDGACNWSSTDIGRSKKLAGWSVRPGLILVNGLPPPSWQCAWLQNAYVVQSAFIWCRS